MPWSDRQIIDWAVPGGIDPTNLDYINPASVDLTLSDSWKDFHTGRSFRAHHVDLHPRSLRVEVHNMMFKWWPERCYITTLMAVTYEYISIPADVSAEVKLKTTPTRKGLGQVIGDWVDPGYRGHLTLIMYAHKRVRLSFGQRIVQMVLWPMTEKSQYPYNIVGHYMNQKEPTGAWDDNHEL